MTLVFVQDPCVQPVFHVTLGRRIVEVTDMIVCEVEEEEEVLVDVIEEDPPIIVEVIDEDETTIVVSEDC